jgi:hypothetical protein
MTKPTDKATIESANDTSIAATLAATKRAYMTTSEKVPCPFVYARGQKCKGHIVRIAAFKADLEWTVIRRRNRKSLSLTGVITRGFRQRSIRSASTISKKRPDQYDHVWEGGFVSIVEGAYDEPPGRRPDRKPYSGFSRALGRRIVGVGMSDRVGP